MYIVAYLFAGRRHVLQQLVQAPPGSNDAALIGISLLADGFEIVAVAPVECHLNKLLLDAVNIVVLNVKIGTSVICILHS
jgi:hypothetical protein